MGETPGEIPRTRASPRGSQEIKVAKGGRGITLLQNAAAGASGILSLDSAVGFHNNCATARWIDAMPGPPGFHNHGPFPPFTKTAGGPQSRPQVGPRKGGQLFTASG